MSSKPRPASDVIALPKGGGALQGIGEKFTPDLHTGTGNLSVPIALPPGRNGFQPQLSLGYSTGNGNGPFGLGWSLGVPGVSRKTSRGIPRYDDAHDVFILSGAEDLVPVPGGAAGVARYRPRTEGIFARIEHQRNAHQDYWTVRSKDGLVSTYGTAAEDSDEAIVAQPGDRRRIFAWKLSQTRDAFGNRIDYRYERDATQSEGPHVWDQVYLSEIRYADYGPRSAPEFLLAVRFHYERRPDSFSDYRAGFEIRTVRRCTHIEVLSRAPTELLVRTYRFTYLDQVGVPPGQLPQNGVSLLARIDVVGHDGREALPPLTFDYSRFEPARRRFSSLRGTDLPARSLADPDLELVDLFGRGLPDVIELGAQPRYWRNLGGGEFSLPRTMRTAPAGLRLADPGVQLLDADGDGRIDLLVSREGLSGYFSLARNGEWDERSFRRYATAPSFNLEDPEVRLVDLDGDGVTDAIRSGTRLECFFNHPERGWDDTRAIERRRLEDFPNLSFADPRVKWADMTGDGLQDPVLVSDGNVEYWPALGRGAWGKRISMRNSPRLPHGYDPRRILLGDVDGDGLADFLYVDDAKVTLWLNRCGNEWSDPIEITGTPPLGANVDVRLIDLLGNGVAGLLWSRDAGGSLRDAWHFLDFTGGVKPYLLRELDDHMGARTEVEYTSSARCCLDDERTPSRRWQTPQPFPVQVVARVKVHDAFSRSELTTEYSYHHGYWDGAEREFRGFGRVDQRDTQTFQVDAGTGSSALALPGAAGAFSPPTETRTWFHQGPIGEASGEWLETDYRHEWWPGDPPLLARERSTEALLAALPRRARRDALRALRGRTLRTELYALDGSQREDRPYTVAEHLHGLREENPPLGGEDERSRVFFPHTLSERTTQWERGQDPLTRFSVSRDHDPYGQPLSQIQIAVPRGRDSSQNAASGEAYLVTQTRTEYAQRDDEHGYIVDRVARQTSYSIDNEQHPAWLEVVERIQTDIVTRTPTGQTRNHYDGPAFEGLPLGQLGEHGALVRSETLVLTPELVAPAYAGPGDVPPYLTPSGDVTWTDEYPRDFRSLIERIGYVYRAAGTDPDDLAGFFSITTRRRYDRHEPDRPARGLVIASQDALGNETRIEHDAFGLLPTRVTNPVGLVTLARYDYRLLQPKEVTDPNGNRTAYAFTSLGLLESSSVMGKPGEPVGDTPEHPGTRLVYNFRAFLERGQPTSVKTIRRVHHATDLDVPLSERDATLTHIEYSDGFGRVLQTRTQAENLIFGDSIFGHAGLPSELTAPAGEAVGRELGPGEARVLVSGWQRYDNKGRVVEKYEPFFSLGWDYREPTDLELGQKATLFYDPRGQLLRSVNPDGTEDRVVYGVPHDLSDPEHFEPTPWESYSYDENDNAGRTHADAARAYAHHWNTPSSARIDALGRVIEKIERNGSTPADQVVTRSSFDVRGNLLSVTDALGRRAFDYVYDLLPKRDEEDKGARVLRLEQLDAGVRRVVYDAAGNEIEHRDAKGALTLHRYDALNRPTSLWARDGERQPVTLRERLLYDGTGSPLPEREIAAANLLGRLHRHYDEAGLLTFAAYDFKGNVLEKERRAVSDATILQTFATASERHWQVDAWRMDWQPFPDDTHFDRHAEALLDPAHYQTSVRYDALDRARHIRAPEDVTGQRKRLELRYDASGALEHVTVDGAVYVEHIARNAKGQRTLIAYGNGVMTRHAYDPRTFQLLRLRTEPYAKEGLSYRPRGPALQDWSYDYDLAGNIVALRDRAPGSGIPNTPLGPDALDRRFTYDPLYRLLSASGRECDRPPPASPWLDVPRCTDLTRTRAYDEAYQYDVVGNLLELRHSPERGGFVRHFALAERSNRLVRLSVGQTEVDYAYDACGNQLRETSSRHLEWDHADHLRVFRVQTAGAEPSMHAHYLYDASGRRVKKIVRRQGGQIDVSVYVDSLFEHHRRVRGATTRENDTLHMMDDQSRIALVRVGDAFSDDGAPEAAVQYHLGDHLGSSNIVLGGATARARTFMNREEHAPYGETSFGSFARKRYRFTGKERDEESGLDYFEARYYVAWVARFASVDPLIGEVSNRGPPASADKSRALSYAYVLCNPLGMVDPDGRAAMVAWAVVAFASTPMGQRLINAGLVRLAPVAGAIANTARQVGPVAARLYQGAGRSLQNLALELIQPSNPLNHLASVQLGVPTLGGLRAAGTGRGGGGGAIGAGGTSVSGTGKGPASASNYHLSPTAQPQRIQGPWSLSDLERASRGQPPQGLLPVGKKGGPRVPELHHADQMPGSGVHEVVPGKAGHLAPGMHPNKYNQGVTPEMRRKDRELHWQMRGQEMGNPPPDRGAGVVPKSVEP